MSGNGESTSNSMKFAPMPMSALLAHLMPLQTTEDNLDSSYTSEDESDGSFADTVAKKPQHLKEKPKALTTSTPKYLVSSNKVFASEKKSCHSGVNKENCDEQSKANWTYPNKESHHKDSSVKKIVTNVHPSTEVKKRSILSIHNAHPGTEDIKRSILTPHNKQQVKSTNSTVKRTPDMVRINSNHKKTPTPKIKCGIRRFTPGSGHRSNKKTPQKVLVDHSNKESVRCLFPENRTREEPSCPPPAPVPPVPETPINKKSMPNLYSATPSYPQGLVKNQSKILFKTTTIKGKGYMYIKKLGTGGSSEVYKVLEVGTSCEYAVKCVNLATDRELARGYINEVRLLKELQNSDRVIRLYDYEYDRDRQFLRLVLEVGETDLSSFLKARGAGLPPALVLYYWEEMLHAVNHIHEHGVIHADLKPANFLLVCGRLKLIDFGIASAVASDATSVVRAQATGTYSYISPEALMGGAGGYGLASGEEHAPIKISFRSDVWSLGCILYSMVHGRTPFGHLPSLAKLAVILDPNHRIEYPPVEHLPPSLIAALKWCLTYNARSRPSVRELLAIPYMQPPKCQCSAR